MNFCSTGQSLEISSLQNRFKVRKLYPNISVIKYNVTFRESTDFISVVKRQVLYGVIGSCMNPSC